MPESIMDYMTLIAGIFTIAAAVATIFGVSFAIGTYGDWKKSYRYAKIIDVDTTINSIKTEIESGLRFFWLYQQSVILGNENREPLGEYEISSKAIDDLVSRYQIQGKELIRMGQKDFNEFMVSPVDVAILMFSKHKNTMERKATIEELHEYYFTQAVDGNDMVFKKMNDYLDRLK